MVKDFRHYGKTLYALAVPVMLEQLGQILLGTVDTYFAGQIGDDAIAAISLTNLFMNLFITAFASLGMAALVKISRALKESGTPFANRILRQALLAGLFIGIGFGFVNLLLHRPFLLWAGARGEILRMGTTYYLAVSVPCVLLCLTTILANGLKAAGSTRSSMAAALAANIANAVLDAAFIRMGFGILGLGLATTLARALNLGILLALYYRRDATLCLRGCGWRVEPAMMRELLVYSIPVMLTHLSARLAILIHGSLILHLGSVYYTANSIATQIDEYACIPSAGFESAAATMVSSSLGARQPEQAKGFAWAAFFANAFWMTAIGAVLAAFALPLAGLFTETTQICEMVRQVLIFMVFFNWTSALSHVLTSAMQGTGNARYPLLVTLGGNLLMRLGAGYLLTYYLRLGLIGIWGGIVLDFLLRGILLGTQLTRFFRSPEACGTREEKM